MAAARATLIREIGDLREQYLDLLELVEERTLHDPQPWPSLEKLYGKYGCYVYITETQWDFTPPRCMQNLRADLVAIAHAAAQRRAWRRECSGRRLSLQVRQIFGADTRSRDAVASMKGDVDSHFEC